MDETPNSITHFMAVGAGQRLGDYLFLRNTFETVSDQEAQLNRILHLLDEDEFALNWYIDTTPIERARSRFLSDYDRVVNPAALPGSIAYQRLRESEKEEVKRQPLVSRGTSYRRIRSNKNDENDNTSLSSTAAARLRALNDDEESRRKQRTKEKYSNDRDQEKKRIELNSFTIRYEEPNGTGDGRLICDWSSPDSISNIDYYTIERQLEAKNWWSNVGKRINRDENHNELDIESLFIDEDQKSARTRFRLKAHLKDGSSVMSDPTDEIFIESTAGLGIIYPNVEILSPSSVQLTWNDETNKSSSKLYDIQTRNGPNADWEKVVEVPLTPGSARLDNLDKTDKSRFRLVPSNNNKGNEPESDVITVHNVNEWLSSLHLVPTSNSTVDIDISEEGFRTFNQYRVEYSLKDEADQWKQIPDIVRDHPHLTIDNLRAGGDYKFRFTPILAGSPKINENVPQLSLVLDVKMPATHKAKLVKNDGRMTTPPQFAIHQVDPKTVFIEAIFPTNRPIIFDDIFDIYSKNEGEDDQWTKIATIDKDHLSSTVKDLRENTAYVFKIDNRSHPSTNIQNNIVQEFQFETASVRQYDPSIFLEKIEQSLESVVSNVMRAAAGHQTLNDPMNISLNEVIKEIFNDETLVPNEQYGFDTLALSSDLQLFRGPKQMMLQELQGNETSDASKTFGEIIIHNYRRGEHEKQLQPVIVREDGGNTRIGNIDGDVIIRNVMTDVLLSNDATRNQLSMNIVGQAFLKGVQGVLVASNFRGIIVVKTVDKP